MKTLKTFLAVLIVISVSSTTFARQGGILGKAKDAAKDAKTKKDAAKATKKGGKGGKDMAVKGSGVPVNNAATKAPANTTPAPAATK